MSSRVGAGGGDQDDPLLVPYSADDPRYVIPRGGITRRISIGRQGSWYTVLGRLLGLAVRESITAGLQLHPSFLFALVQKVPVLEDIRVLDEGLYTQLNNVLTCTDLAALDMVFSETIEEEKKVNGVFTVERKDVDLKPNGANIAVTKDNVQEYITLLIQEKFVRGTVEEMERVRNGFLDVFEGSARILFPEIDPVQLGAEIGGVQAIDVADWKAHTKYREPLAAEHQLVVWFWSVVEEDMTDAERLLLLKFATSLTALPVGGFGALRGTSAVDASQFELAMLPIQGSGAYPQAHTCFNRLDLPQYPSRAALKDKLFESISDPSSESFENG